MSNKPNYKPLGDRVIVLPDSAEQTTKSGIFIPDTSKERPQSGKVVAAGPGRVSDEGKTIPLSVKEGDTVIFSKYGGTEIKVDMVEYLIVKESDILAVQA